MDSSNFSVLFVFIFPFAVFLSFSPFFFFGSDQKYYSEFETKVLVSQVLVPAIGGFTWDTFVEWGRGRNLHSQELRPILREVNRGPFPQNCLYAVIAGYTG